MVNFLGLEKIISTLMTAKVWYHNDKNSLHLKHKNTPVKAAYLPAVAAARNLVLIRWWHLVPQQKVSLAEPCCVETVAVKGWLN